MGKPHLGVEKITSCSHNLSDLVCMLLHLTVLTSGRSKSTTCYDHRLPVTGYGFTHYLQYYYYMEMPQISLMADGSTFEAL
jgi:hypothetical protein